MIQNKFVQRPAYENCKQAGARRCSSKYEDTELRTWQPIHQWSEAIGSANLPARMQSTVVVPIEGEATRAAAVRQSRGGRRRTRNANLFSSRILCPFIRTTHSCRTRHCLRHTTACFDASLGNTSNSDDSIVAQF